MYINIIDIREKTIEEINFYCFFILDRQLYMKVEHPFVINIKEAKKVEMNPKTFVQPCTVEGIIVKKC